MTMTRRNGDTGHRHRQTPNCTQEEKGCPEKHLFVNQLLLRRNTPPI